MTYKILTLNNIATKGLDQFPREYYEVSSELSTPDAILVRSHNMHNMVFPQSVQVVGRAGAGVNNIPLAKLSRLGVPVLNTPGANANAVKELVLAGMLIASRNIYRAWDYMQHLSGTDEQLHTTLEAQKKQFVGSELAGKTLAVIGMGSIGISVANTAIDLGMRVIGFDPSITTDNAWRVSAEVVKAHSLDELLSVADFVSIHVPLIDATRGLLNHSRLEVMKNTATLLNFSRDGIVDNAALKAHLATYAQFSYVSDFPNNALKDLANTIHLPHLGASTVEAEQNCAMMVAKQVRDYLEHGTICHAVNFPTVRLSRTTGYRLAIANENVPNMVAQISEKLSHAGLNIIDFLNKSRDEVAYSLIDVDQTIDDAVCADIEAIEGVLRVRRINGEVNG